jgi:DNA topoisomerase-2
MCVCRLEYYGKRKKYLEGMIGAEAARLSNQARFILEKCDGTVKIENKKKQVMIDELARRGYDSDPVKTWKKTQVIKWHKRLNLKFVAKFLG